MIIITPDATSLMPSWIPIQMSLYSCQPLAWYHDDLVIGEQNEEQTTLHCGNGLSCGKWKFCQICEVTQIRRISSSQLSSTVTGDKKTFRIYLTKTRNRNCSLMNCLQHNNDGFSLNLHIYQLYFLLLTSHQINQLQLDNSFRIQDVQH